MRLIDADVIEAEITDSTGAGKILRNWIRVQPIVDAKIVKHGKWMYRERTVAKNNIIKECFVNPGGYTLCYVDREMKVVKEPYCSECDWHGKEDFEETSFCPNCGAIMDL